MGVLKSVAPGHSQPFGPIALMAGGLDAIAGVFSLNDAQASVTHELLIGNGPWPRPAALPAVLAWVPESEARLPRRVRFPAAEVMRDLREAGCERFYWAVDPYLKTLSGVDILEALTITRADMAVIAPAWPRADFRTIGGYQLLGHAPIDWPQHSAAKGVRGSYIPDLLGSADDTHVTSITWRDTRTGIDAILRGMFDALNNRKTALVIDAISEADLDTVARAIALVPWRVLPIGSAGLFASLQGGPQKRVATLVSDPRPRLSTRPTLGIVTSPPLPQLMLNTAALPAGIRSVNLPLEAILLGESQIVETSLTQALAFLLDRQDVLFHVTPRAESPDASGALLSALNLNQGLIVMRINQLIASLIREAKRLTQLAGIVVVGGEAGTSVLSEWGANWLIGEESPVPGSTIFRLPDGPTPVYFSIVPEWQFDQDRLQNLMQWMGRMPR